MRITAAPSHAQVLERTSIKFAVHGQREVDLPMLAKPYRSDELAARVRAVLAARRQTAKRHLR